MDILSALRSVVTSIKTWTNEKLNNKVDVVEGKGLSANDLTDELVSKINSVEALEVKVGAIPDDSEATTVIDYINEKTANATSDAAVQELGARVSTIEGDYLKSADKEELSTRIDNAVTVASEDATSKADKALADAKTYASDLNTAMGRRVGTLEENVVILENEVADISSSLRVKSVTISLLAANWTGDASPYSQVVSIVGVTSNSKIDLQPTAEQLVSLQDEEVSLVTANSEGVITVYAIGNKPTADITMQATITEVVADE